MRKPAEERRAGEVSQIAGDKDRGIAEAAAAPLRDEDGSVQKGAAAPQYPTNATVGGSPQPEKGRT
jgi:hypothetical protein